MRPAISARENPAPEHFADWNEQRVQQHNPELFDEHPSGVVRWVERHRLKAVLRGINLRADNAVLDVGCGSGKLLRRLVCTERHGLELSPSMARRASQVVGSLGKIVQGDAEKMPYPDARFERTIASSLLSHVLRPERVISELRRVTRPGGRIIISVSDEDQIERGMRWLHISGLQKLFLRSPQPGAAVYNIDYHLHRFSLKRLRELAGSDLHEISVTPVPVIFPVHWVVVYEK